MKPMDDAWAARECRRWMQPSAHLYIRPDAWRFMPAGAPKYYGKDAVRYFWPEEKRDPPPRQEAGDDDPEARRAERELLLDLRGELLAIKADIRFRRFARALKYNFNPAEPRVPAGNPDGGQWTSESLAGPDLSKLDDDDQVGLVQLAQYDGSITDADGGPYYKPGGHHEMPREVYSGWKLLPETKRVFEQSTTGRLPQATIRTAPNGEPLGNFWNNAHRQYNEAVRELSNQFMQANNIKPELMTPAQAQELLRQIRETSDPRIRLFNANMRILRRIFPFRAGRGVD